MLWSDTVRRWLPALGTAIPLIILPIAILSIPLAAAQEMRLSAAETTSWILVLYGLPGLLGLVLTIRYRQPLLLTGNVFVLIFIASLGSQLSYPEIVGASIVAGGSVLLISALGLTDWLAARIPAPIVLGLLAGATMPFVSGIFTTLGDEPVLIGGTFVAYVLGHRVLGMRVPAILPALVVGLAIAALTGELGQVPARSPLALPTVTTPDFTVHAIATATPVLVILITLQSNVPSVVFLRNQDYHPPESLINNISGVGTLVGSLLGPTGVSLSLPATALAAGPDAGEHQLRHRSVYLASAAVVVIGLLAGIAAELPEIIPLRLLLALAGLAVIGVLANALQQIIRGPLLLGPLFAFAVALSKISILGFGPFFWALVIGTGVSLLLERDELQVLRSPAPE
ncbi:benzoate/H(+) symporter BenE family transporter [soil metagenome]